MREPLAAVVTAGGRVARTQFPAADLPEGIESEGDLLPKALLQVDGRTLLERVLEAVRATGRAERIVVVGAASLQRWLRSPAETLLPEHAEAHENLLVGLQAVAHYPRALYLTSDLPFVTAEAICRFLEACPEEAQLCYAIARREAFDARFPNSPSVYARMKDGEWLAGCAMLIDPSALLQRAEWVRRVAQRRKSLWQLAMLAGWGVLWRFATRQLTVADVERRAEQLLGIHCRAVECAPELAYDVDTPQEYEYARRLADGGAG
ncbi:MAG: nucleotidyltransferase family protein [bacterium]|nr:nucleotidyltransferase family protein [bacterium]MCS7310301.1 nucleotidyltransferase family protein [Armatimonadota bacterium]MDW8105479.1 NTP transferase domain-containing protein [Armatimonadota bacterium]